eukprot:5506533-Prymnesium_polylepis.1
MQIGWSSWSQDACCSAKRMPRNGIFTRSLTHGVARMAPRSANSPPSIVSEKHATLHITAYA